MGQGRSKKIARIEAAATALRSFIQFKDGAVLTPLKPACNLDFTSDEHLDNGTTSTTDTTIIPCTSATNVENLSQDELVELVENWLQHVKRTAKLTASNTTTSNDLLFEKIALSMSSKYSFFNFVFFFFIFFSLSFVFFKVYDFYFTILKTLLFLIVLKSYQRFLKL